MRLVTLAGIAVAMLALAGIAMLGMWQSDRANATFVFFCLWGLAALVGAAANIAVHLAGGDPPKKPPRGGLRVTPLRRLPAHGEPDEQQRREREAA